jgi:hypothetical protein
MITKEQAFSVLETYLLEKKRDYVSINPVENIGLIENKKCLYGKYAHQRKNVFVASYSSLLANEERGVVVYISAENGEVLYSISSHGWVEETEG